MITDQIGHLDGAFEHGVMLDVKAMELHPTSPGVRAALPQWWLKEVLNLVVVYVQCQRRMGSLCHQLLAEVGPDEAPDTDNADRHRLDGVPVQIHPRHLYLAAAFRPPTLPSGSVDQRCSKKRNRKTK